MRIASRLAALAAGAVLLTLASSAIPRTRLEVQDWECPPAPASCARPVEVRGFPLPYISDYHGLSPVGQADLIGAVLGMDRFHPDAFWVDVGLYGLLLAGVCVAWTHRLARRARA